MKKLVRLSGLRFFLFIVMLSFSNVLISQELSRSELETTSVNYFKNSKYNNAQKGFEELISIYPKEISYNYYLGRCYLHLNILLNKATNYLRYAASKNYKPDVHYYLSLAYFRNYQFDDAEIALVNFINLAKKRDLLSLKPEILLASITKAREETYMAEKLHVFTKEELNYSQIESVYALHIEGKFIPKDKVFMQQSDIKKNYQGLMYVPVISDNGYKYYLASIGKTGRTGKDIFQVKQLTDMDYTLPKSLSINTKYDEEYPFFDNKTQTLYFSSNRPGGNGGYDIYKSEYSETTNSFSEPKRLEFPVNTPFDDFLYVPDKEGKTAVFLSNRSNSGEQLTAYKIEIGTSPDYVFPKSQKDIIELAALEILIDKATSPLVIENLSPAKPPVVLSEYDLLIEEALSKQLVCDSLQAAIISQKNRLRIEENIDQRRILISSITDAEKYLNELQLNANELFAKAEKMQQANTASDIAVNKNSAQNDTTENLIVAKEEEKNTEMSDNGVIYLQSESIVVNNQFEILNNSPYTENTPIPYEQELPEGLIYRIQLGAFSQNLPMNTFGGLTPLTAEKIDEKKVTKYYVGYFASSKEARKALDKVKNYGFGDAFLVPFYNKSKITIQAAREIEFGTTKQ